LTLPRSEPTHYPFSGIAFRFASLPIFSCLFVHIGPLFVFQITIKNKSLVGMNFKRIHH
jgi:hypothetical protein